MMVSLLPVDPTSTGLAVTEEIHIKAQILPWANSTLWVSPTYPEATSDPVSTVGASLLKYGIISLGASLFNSL